MKPLLCLLVLCVFAASLSATDHVFLTIYDQNYAVVRDVRSFTFTKGENEIRFPDISPLILNEPVRLSGDDVQLLEQTFQFHRVTNNLLLDDHLGKRVEFFLRDSTRVGGTLIGYADADRDATPRFVVQLDGRLAADDPPRGGQGIPLHGTTAAIPDQACVDVQGAERQCRNARR